MGFGKLKEIVDLYQDYGKGELPIAIIQNGSLANERVVLGRIDSILQEAERSLVGVPAIIVLGKWWPNMSNLMT